MLIDRISNDLRLSVDFLQVVARTASLRYRRYQIPKRSGGSRTIDHPARELKAIQRWLATNVITLFPVHDAATAYKRGSSIAHNAAAHAGSRFSVRLDFANFFPSLTASDIEVLCAHRRPLLPRGWSDDDTHFLAACCCRKRRLTIGAPSSPQLSNALCYELDEQIHLAARRSGARYTRYADDIFLSTVRPGTLRPLCVEIREIVRSLTYPSALEINNSKTYHASRKHRRVITGVTLTSDGGISLGRSKKRVLRARVHQAGLLSDDELKKLAGELGHAKGIEPSLVTRLATRYGARVIAQIKTGNGAELRFIEAANTRRPA